MVGKYLIAVLIILLLSPSLALGKQPIRTLEGLPTKIAGQSEMHAHIH
jgi:hypothetical protein